MPNHIVEAVAKGIREPAAAQLRELLQLDGVTRANLNANKHLLLPRFLIQMLEWSEHPGDAYSKAWSTWIVLTLLHHDDARMGRISSRPSPVAKQQSAEGGLMVFVDDVEEKHLLRRAKLLAEQQAVALNKPTLDDALKGKVIASPAVDVELLGPGCHTTWLQGSPRLGALLGRMTISCLGSEWRESQLLACAASARLIAEHPHFLCHAAGAMDASVLIRFAEQLPDKLLRLVSLVLIAVVASYRLPLKAQNCSSAFLMAFYGLQEQVIEGIAALGEGPYDVIARWLHEPNGVGAPCEEDFRCLVIFITGQCLRPPLAAAPSLDAIGPDAAPPVIECEPPPKALLDRLAEDVLAEDRRLREEQVNSRGPMFSTALCHLVYALSAMVPSHPQDAASLPSVRGAAFSQLMKVQQIIAQSLRSQDLYDAADGERAKLFLYIRAMGCIKLSLRVVTGSWYASDVGARFVVTEQGGRDFIQYCTKHIIQVHNSKTAVTRLLGTPWERAMLAQGPTETIAELLLMVCSSDANLAELGRLGGDKALHALSHHAERPAIRQQATMLLSKLAVLKG